MLRHLHIQNYALIKHLDIDFEKGFSVLTGETGAGKSIILGALGLVMGTKADPRSISEGEDLCVIEAEFDEYLIRRELHAAGRSRSFVNDEIVSQSDLKALSRKLIDIHSQHENLLISDDSFQLSVVDAIAQNESERSAYLQIYTTFRNTESELQELQKLAAKSRNDEDYIRFQLTQLEEANLSSDELEELEAEHYRLSHAEEIGMQLSRAIQQLGDEGGALTLMRESNLEADESLQERLQSITIELKDILFDAEKLLEHTEANPARLEEVEERLDTINTLLRKHNVTTVGELIDLKNDLAKQIGNIDGFDEQIHTLKQKLEVEREQMQSAALVLTKSREKVRKAISEQLISTLTSLGIRHANIDIEISPLSDYDESGHDNIQFLFAANLNQSLRRVSEVASGGEISRVMLSIKALIASTTGLPTIIFDEIDTGVSGDIATQMGHIMHNMATSRQIISITHLPQIAVQGDYQYHVYKADEIDHTETHISLMSEQERKQYIDSQHATFSRAIASKDA